MRKTNSKEVKNAVRSYILECIPEGMTVKEVHENFINTYFKTENEKRYFNNNERKAFENWLTTIPSAFDVEFATWEICKIVGSWLDETEEEIEKYFDKDAMKTENLFRYLITKHFYEILAELQKEVVIYVS